MWSDYNLKKTVLLDCQFLTFVELVVVYLASKALHTLYNKIDPGISLWNPTSHAPFWKNTKKKIWKNGDEVEQELTVIITSSQAYNNPSSSSPVRIPGFHPGDPGSNPGDGAFLYFFFSSLTRVMPCRTVNRRTYNKLWMIKCTPTWSSFFLREITWSSLVAYVYRSMCKYYIL